MGLRFFGQQTSPIAIDFGSSSVKLLQTGLGDRPTLLAAAELPMPNEASGNGHESLAAGAQRLMPPAENFEYLANELPKLLRAGGFKGRRVIFAVPSQQTIIQHLQLNLTEGIKREDAVKAQLQMQMNMPPHNTVVRSIDVTEIQRDGQMKTELICFAIPRDIVMGYVGLLEKMRLQVLDVHTEVQAMVQAFDHIHRRAQDENVTTMYIDLGWRNTHVAIAHGTAITFARSIQIGGMNFDMLIAGQLKCDLAAARAHRLTLENPAQVSSKPAAAAAPLGSATTRGDSAARRDGPDDDDGGDFARLAAAMAKERAAETIEQDDRRDDNAPEVLPKTVKQVESEPIESPAPRSENIDLSEVLGTITDELTMCLRYHHGLFPNRQIDRVILLGGESRQPWLCRHIVRALRIPARLGDPLARFVRDDRTRESVGLAENQAQPGWAVASGLVVDPTD